MRAMLKLIFLCSLAQFAIAEPPFLPDGCNTVYKCFAPESCGGGSTILLTEGEITELTGTTTSKKIVKTCSALIKFHAYKKYWVHVAIDSLDSTTKSVQFIQNNLMGQKKNDFKCKLNSASKWEGFHNDRLMVSVAKNNDNKCEFEIRLGTSEDFFKPDSAEMKMFKLDEDDSKSTIPTSSPNLQLTEHCDPSNLNFDKKDHSDTEVYSEVIYSPGKFYCKDSRISTLQYRADTGKYIDSKDNILTCPGNVPGNVKKFVDDAGNPPVGEYLDARCSADVKYFCSDQPQYKNKGEKLAMVVPDRSTAKAGSLKCPDGHPHLYINGKPSFKEGTRAAPDFKCINYGATQLWTVNGIRLTSTGPEAYCSNKLVCKDLYKIQQSSVLRGRLNIDDKPECFAGGKLHEHSGTKQPASNFRCDESTGEYKYDAGGVAKNVEGVKFECIYPPPIDYKGVNAKNEQTLAIGVTVSGVVVGILTFGLFGFFVWFARWSYQKERKRQQAADKAAYELYTMNKKQREKIREKKMKDREEARKNAKATPSPSSEASVDQKLKERSDKMMAALSYKLDFLKERSAVVKLANKYSTIESPNGLLALDKKRRGESTVCHQKEFQGRGEKKFLKLKANGFEAKKEN